MEVLAAGCPAVVVPYAGGLETEQSLRCRLLAERGLLRVVDEAGLDPATLLAAVQRALEAPRASEQDGRGWTAPNARPGCSSQRWLGWMREITPKRLQQRLVAAPTQ
jgi:hypothetical protein